jgi:hypothetical protein
MSSTKESWPELVGKTGEESKAAILKERAELNVVIIKDGSPVTRDYREDRVRVVVDEQNEVVVAPRTG